MSVRLELWDTDGVPWKEVESPTAPLEYVVPVLKGCHRTSLDEPPPLESGHVCWEKRRFQRVAISGARTYIYREVA